MKRYFSLEKAWMSYAMFARHKIKLFTLSNGMEKGLHYYNFPLAHDKGCRMNNKKSTNISNLT